MNEFYIALAAVGGIVLVVGLVSGYLEEHSLLSAPILALALGVLLGPGLLGWVDLPRGLDAQAFMQETARLTIALGLMPIALRLPTGWVRAHRRALVVMYGLVMPLMWIVSALLAWAFLPLSFWGAMLVGAMLSPTDPVLARALVTGPFAERMVPARVRRLISAESGANDGLAYPFVLLAVTEMGDHRLLHWLWRAVGVEVVGAAICGAVLGWLGGQALARARRRGVVERVFLRGYTIALTLVVLGAARLLTVDGLLAVFVAGLAFSRVVDDHTARQERRVQEAVNQFFVLPFFLLVGTVLPWSAWGALGWRAVALVAAVLLLRRAPAVVAARALIPQLHDLRDALFTGWFGPMGVGTVFYALLGARAAGLPMAWTVGSLVFFASVLVHGATATPLTRRYAAGHAARGRAG